MELVDERWLVIACDNNFLVTEIIAVKNLDVNLEIRDLVTKIISINDIDKFSNIILNLKNEKVIFGDEISVVEGNNSFTIMDIGAIEYKNNYIIAIFSNYLGLYEELIKINEASVNHLRKEMKHFSVSPSNYQKLSSLNNEVINIQREIYKKNAYVLDLLSKKQGMINIIDNQKNVFQQMLNSIPDLIFYKDTLSRYLGCNKAFAEQYIGLEEEEIIGKTDLDIVKDKALARVFRQSDKEVLVSGVANCNDVTIRLLNNKLVDMETIKTPFFDETGKISGLIGVSRDISLRKSTEEKLRESEEKFRLLFENMTNCFSLHEVILGEHGEPVDFSFLMVNKAYENQMNQRSEEILGKTMLELNPAADKEMIQKYCQVGITGWPIQLEYFSKTFDAYFNTFTYSPQKGLFASVFENVTKRKNIELELLKAKEQAEAENIMKSQFLANMSHEIRTPMNGMLGFLELLEKTNLSSEQKGYIREAKIASGMLLYLINDILDLSKIEAGKLKIENIIFNIRTVINDSVSILVPKALKKDIEIHTIVKANVPKKVIGDPVRLSQILSNLVSNAIKFTEIGAINISVDCIEEIDNKVLLSFEVQDTGIGISQLNLSKLFRPFTQADASTTRKFGGTGLGLVISKQLVKLMHGEFFVKSEILKGSNFRFTVLLGVSEEANANREPLEDDIKIDINTILNLQPQILLVDDNEVNRRIIIQMLKYKNMSCDIAVNGYDAVKALREKDYNIVFMDCQMPVMDGYESTGKIRVMEGDKKHTTIVAMTANAMDGDRAKCLKAGMDEYISKPINFDIMFRMIEDSVKIGYSKKEPRDYISNNIDNFVESTGLKEVDARAIFAAYIKLLPNIIENINEGIRKNDFLIISRFAHQLKGSSGNLRLKLIYELSMNLESAALNKEIEKCNVLLMEIRKIVSL